MIHELVYTSAAETFDGPGYGVVARTRELPDAVQKQMLRLCRYDFLSSEQWPESGPPEILSHTMVSNWHILSRCALAGLDYTQRSVFIAHHIAIEHDELGSIAPFDLILSPQLFQREWSGPPEILPGRSLRELSAPKPTRGHWRQAFGHDEADQSWQQMHARNLNPLFLLSESSQSNLKMFCEALRTMNRPEALNVTFISAIGTDYKGVRFDWIGLLKGTLLADTMCKDASGRLLDSTRPMQLPTFDTPMPVRQAPLRSTHPIPNRPSPAPSITFEEAPVEEPDTYGLNWQEDWQVPAGERPRATTAVLPPPPPLPVPDNRWMMIGGAVVGTLVSVVVLMALLMSPGTKPENVVTVPSTNANTNEANTTAQNQGSVDTPGAVVADIGNAAGGNINPGGDGAKPAETPPTGAAGGTPSHPAGASGSAPGATAEPKGEPFRSRGQFFLDRGLLQAAEDGKDKEDKWVSIARLPKGPRLKTFTLLGPLADRLTTASDGEEFVITPKDVPNPAGLRLRCDSKNNEVQMKAPAHNWDEVVSILRLCQLRLASGAEADPIARYELAFNQPHPGLQDQFNSSDLHQDFSTFYHALYEHREKLTLECRIHTLSLLNAPIASGLKLEQKLGGEESALFPVKLNLPRIDKFELSIKPHFDRNSSVNRELPPLELEPLIFREPPKKEPGKDEPDGKAQGGKDDKDAKADEGGKTDKEPKKPPTAKKPPPKPALSTEETLRQASDTELFQEMFRRYGSVSGVLLLKAGAEEFPVVRFGVDENPAVEGPAGKRE